MFIKFVEDPRDLMLPVLSSKKQFFILHRSSSCSCEIDPFLSCEPLETAVFLSFNEAAVSKDWCFLSTSKGKTHWWADGCILCCNKRCGFKILWQKGFVSTHGQANVYNVAVEKVWQIFERNLVNLNKTGALSNRFRRTQDTVVSIDLNLALSPLMRSESTAWLVILTSLFNICLVMFGTPEFTCSLICMFSTWTHGNTHIFHQVSVFPGGNMWSWKWSIDVTGLGQSWS